MFTSHCCILKTISLMWSISLICELFHLLAFHNFTGFTTMYFNLRLISTNYSNGMWYTLHCTWHISSTFYSADHIQVTFNWQHGNKSKLSIKLCSCSKEEGWQEVIYFLNNSLLFSFCQLEHTYSTGRFSLSKSIIFKINFAKIHTSLCVVVINIFKTFLKLFLTLCS